MRAEYVSTDLESNAYRADNGQFGWSHGQIPLVVDILRSRGLAILGGELLFGGSVYAWSPAHDASCFGGPDST